MDGVTDWEQRYRAAGAIWGDDPSALGRFLAAWLRVRRRIGPDTRLLDVGCGYGRDSAYLAAILGVSVLGIDLSPQAIEQATDHLAPGLPALFRCCAFEDLEPEPFDVIMAAGVYHLLSPSERARFRVDVMAHLAPGGVMALSALSTDDPQHYGKGTRVSGEIDSFVAERYLHFFTRSELQRDFESLRLLELFEHSFEEPHNDGSSHHHASWVLLAER